MSRVSGERKTSARSAQPLDAGLYVVSTPIGNLRDITLRALDVLSSVDEILAEDTRMARRLLDAHGIRAKVSPYHDHNGAGRRPDILEKLEKGQALALISDAGTPLVSDPGWKLTDAVIDAGYPIIPVPGASALLSGLITSGLPSDRFMFCGFLSPKSGARRKQLEELKDIKATLVFYEGGSRMAACLEDMAQIFDDTRSAAVARELTKLFEETRRGSLSELSAFYQIEGAPKGEIVILVGPPSPQDVTEADLDIALKEALKEHSLKQAAASVAVDLGLPKRDVYQRGLFLKNEAE